MVGSMPAVLEGPCSVATPLVTPPRKRSMPPPLRLEGEAEKGAGSIIADALPAVDAFPDDLREEVSSSEVGVTCAVGATTNRFAVEDKASEYAVCLAIDADEVAAVLVDWVGRAAADGPSILENPDAENDDGVSCEAIDGTLEDVVVIELFLLNFAALGLLLPDVAALEILLPDVADLSSAAPISEAK